MTTFEELQNIISFCDNMTEPAPRSDFERGMNKAFDYVRQYAEAVSKMIINNNTKGGEN